MPTAHLICGYICSGKTTFARELEQERGAVRFTLDEWLVQHYGGYPPADKLSQVTQEVIPMIWQDAQMALSLGRDVILDMGFWKRADRDAARRLLSFFDVQFYLVVCDEDMAWARIENRNKDSSDQHMLISRDLYNASKGQIDRFTEDEDFVIVQSGD